jgi:hypothetical protein
VQCPAALSRESASWKIHWCVAGWPIPPAHSLEFNDVSRQTPPPAYTAEYGLRKGRLRTHDSAGVCTDVQPSSSSSHNPRVDTRTSCRVLSCSFCASSKSLLPRCHLRYLLLLRRGLVDVLGSRCRGTRGWPAQLRRSRSPSSGETVSVSCYQSRTRALHALIVFAPSSPARVNSCGTGWRFWPKLEGMQAALRCPGV